MPVWKNEKFVNLILNIWSVTKTRAVHKNTSIDKSLESYILVEKNIPFLLREDILGKGGKMRSNL